MKTGVEFIQRLQEDAEFRDRVNACPGGEERLAFLKSQGYDFSPFVQIMHNLSYGKQYTGWSGQPGGSAGYQQTASGFLGRLSQRLRADKAPRPNR
jgi:hypothetical protein